MAYIDEVNRLKDLQKQQAMAQLANARDNALSNLGQERQNTMNTYYDKRNQATNQSQLGAKSFAEYLAAKGIMGGASNQAALMNNANLQNSLTQYGRDEANAYNNIASRETQAQNNYQNDLTSSYNNIEADAANKILAYRQQQEQLAAQKAAAQAKAQATAAKKAASPTEQLKQAKDAINQEINKYVDSGDRLRWLQQNQGNIINSLGADADAIDYYNSLVKDANKYSGYYHGGYQYA